MPRNWLLLLALSAVLLCSTLAAAEVTVARDGGDPCSIYTAPKPSGPERAAAAALAQYLTRITGAEFTVSAVAEPPKGRAILIGQLAGDVAKELPGDSFVIRTVGDQLHIVGTTPMGTAFGVFALLEEHLGCRWWSHTEEEVPERKTIVLPEIDDVRRARFVQPGLLNREAQSRRNHFQYKLRAVHTEKFTGGHNLYALLKDYGKKHPEIYPLNRKSGQRAPNNLHFCYMAPGIADALVEAIDREIKRRKGNVKDYVYFAGMGDWYGGMCQCEICRKIYEEETWVDPDGRKKPGYSATLLRMINKAAAALDKKWPGVRIGTFAYMSLEAPPAKTVPARNVVLRVPHLRHCIIHPVRACGKNASFKRNIERWCELAPGRVYVWDYGVNFGQNFLYPFPLIRTMSDNIRYYAKIGVAGVMVQGNYVSTGSDLVVLKNHVWAKMMWQPENDPIQLIGSFCEGYYGPAAPAMTDYVLAIEDYAFTSKTHIDEFARRAHIQKAFLSPDVEKQLRGHLAQALEAAGEREPWRRRVLEAQASLEAWDLWHAGPLVEKDGRLVRADLGNQYTWPRALNLIEHCRDASPREWGGGRAYRLSFLTLHGGPLPTLKRERLTVKVAPALIGRIYQIAHDGKPLLRIGDPKERGYPNVGGAWERLIPGPRVCLLDGEPTESQVEVTGECGIANWGGSTKQICRKRVELLAPEGSIRITGFARQIVRGKQYAEARQILVTEYQTTQHKPPSTEFAKGKAEWQEARFAAPDAAADKKPATPVMRAELPEGVTALRIALPGKGCRVHDLYLAPHVLGGRVTFDPRTGVLTTSVNTGAVGVNPEEETRTYERLITVQALDAE